MLLQTQHMALSHLNGTISPMLHGQGKRYNPDPSIAANKRPSGQIKLSFTPMQFH